jgi:hypothetical protein
MRMVVLIGAAVMAVTSLVASGALAGVVSRAECGDRIVKKPLVPARPGCQYKTCRITYTREHDNKGGLLPRAPRLPGGLQQALGW